MENVLIFGASGMVGQGVLRECLLDPRIKKIQAIGRTPVESDDERLQNFVHSDLWNYDSIQDQLRGFDACFFCLGTTSAGKTEQEYTHITQDLTLAAAQALVKLNPNMTFIYVSGQGADNTEKSKAMWARVRGHTENALRGLPFKAVYIFRPGMIQPLHDAESKTPSYRLMYRALRPVLPTLRKRFPNFITTTEQIGRAMLAVAANGADKAVLTNRDFDRIVPN
ncbi:MAG: NAD(P)H-binding protein [Chitinophagaceae bacterium]|nr:NAD(P)H-binding protein [Oligoflexus sp.]